MLLLQVVQSFYFLRVLSEEMAQNGREILSLHQNALDDDISRIADSISSYWPWTTATASCCTPNRILTPTNIPTAC